MPCTHTRLAILRPLLRIALCIAIALGVMALVPRPVEPLPDPKESDLHSKPNWIELLEALSPHLNTYTVNGVHTKVFESLQRG